LAQRRLRSLLSGLRWLLRHPRPQLLRLLLEAKSTSYRGSGPCCTTLSASGTKSARAFPNFWKGSPALPDFLPKSRGEAFPSQIFRKSLRGRASPARFSVWNSKGSLPPRDFP
jgi:hypothetical protein